MTEELERLRGTQQAQEKDALALDHDFRKLNEEYNRATSRLSVARLELERLRKESDRSAEQKTRNLELLAQKDQQRLTQEQALEQARAQLGELQAKATQVAEEHSVLRARAGWVRGAAAGGAGVAVAAGKSDSEISHSGSSNWPSRWNGW